MRPKNWHNERRPGWMKKAKTPKSHAVGKLRQRYKVKLTSRLKRRIIYDPKIHDIITFLPQERDDEYQSSARQRIL